MAVDDGLDVAQFPHLRQQAGVQAGRAGRFLVLAGQDPAAVLEPFREFAKRDMEEGQGRHGNASVPFGKRLTVIPIPLQLGKTDVIVRMDFLLPFQDDGVHRIEQIQDAVRA